jgi:[pyruvate, water dikinase]-phosphate phosphotransferase / [pyruvate, water dikinase] kinase
VPESDAAQPALSPPVLVVSGGAGASGAQLVHTALAQFEAAQIEVIILPHIVSPQQIDDAVEQAAALGGAIIHTLVDAGLRQALAQRARTLNVAAIDLMGPVLTHLAGLLSQDPSGRPGLYRQLNEEYFQRVDAMEFTVTHDDGRKPDGLTAADIVLIGVSRVGKTPLSMYLALQGWKVANVPLVANIAPPSQLLEVDPRRVIGLTISLQQLMVHRRVRGQRLGAPGEAYTDPDDLRSERQMVVHFCSQHGFQVIDVTDRPIEETAYGVVAAVNRGPSSPA